MYKQPAKIILFHVSFKTENIEALFSIFGVEIVLYSLDNRKELAGRAVFLF